MVFRRSGNTLNEETQNAMSYNKGKRWIQV